MSIYFTISQKHNYCDRPRDRCSAVRPPLVLGRCWQSRVLLWAKNEVDSLLHKSKKCHKIVKNCGIIDQQPKTPQNIQLKMI